MGCTASRSIDNIEPQSNNKCRFDNLDDSVHVLIRKEIRHARKYGHVPRSYRPGTPIEILSVGGWKDYSNNKNNREIRIIDRSDSSLHDSVVTVALTEDYTSSTMTKTF